MLTREGRSLLLRELRFGLTEGNSAVKYETPKRHEPESELPESSPR